MSLGDVMSRMHLTTWAEIGLVIFFGVFVALVVRTWARSREPEFERARRLPLVDDQTSAPAPVRAAEEHA
jgi:cbb3-type cytochrome oxidase subunit 3